MARGVPRMARGGGPREVARGSQGWPEGVPGRWPEGPQDGQRGVPGRWPEGGWPEGGGQRVAKGSILACSVAGG